MRKIRKAVIPAAGLGTRFLPVTKVVPKELLLIGNKPSILYVIEEAVASGVEDVILVTNRHKTALLDFFKPNRELLRGLEEKGKRQEAEELKRIDSLAKITIVYQDEPKGLGHAVLRAKRAVGDEPFVVILPDVLVKCEIPATIQLAKACQNGDDWGVLLEKVSRERISQYGIVGGHRVSPDLIKVERAVEKPKPDNAPSDLAILGRYLFTPEIFPLIESSRQGALGELQLTDAINALAEKRPGCGVLCKGEVLDVGTPEGMFQAWEKLRPAP